MAIVKFGPTVVGARGTIAGTIFSANKAGPFARGWSKGSNPNSSLQTGQRGQFGALAAAWRDLTDSQKDDWNDYADDPAQELTNSLGETYFASGFNWYVKINDQLEAAGDARRVDAPTLTRPLAPILTVFTTLWTTGAVSESRIVLSASSPNLGFDHNVVARITGQGRTAIVAGFTFLTIEVPDGSRRILFQDELESAFGTIALGQRMFVQVRSQDSHGQRSPLDARFADAQSV